MAEALPQSSSDSELLDGELLDGEPLDGELLDGEPLDGEPLDLRVVAEEREPQADPARVARLVRTHHAFVWRCLRRLGVPASDVDDAAQKVFFTASRRLAEIAEARERSFLFATSVRVAANDRRAERRKRHMGIDDVDVYRAEGPSPEQTFSDRALLDKLLEPLPLPLRSIFILFELEQMSKQEIAEVLELPEGTVASRLRRAREIVEKTIARLRRDPAGAR